MAVDGGQWEFYQDARREWHWRYHDSDRNPPITLCSEVAFESLFECIEDAVRHGFKRG
jgi:hypothetical protein